MHLNKTRDERNKPVTDHIFHSTLLELFACRNLEAASPYSQALENDLGSTLQLLDFLLARTDDVSQDSENQHASSPAREGKDLSKTDPHQNLIESISGLSQEQSRRHIMAALLQSLQLKTFLDSVEDRGRQPDDKMAAKDSETGGFEKLLDRLPASSSGESANIDDVIPAAIKSKRGRHGYYGAMPPTNELCRMLNMRCY
ncbi:hypothetical protein RRG08_042211 [Elysia crispata]|uniref:Uncharacterized protein n=1 Tax=Elysia crispata TaxID=231223 RepID=A0AAE1ECK9_9GAST|nr:hypothetical protein RRG08_042211 [Elysia crispata]